MEACLKWLLPQLRPLQDRWKGLPEGWGAIFVPVVLHSLVFGTSPNNGKFQSGYCFVLVLNLKFRMTPQGLQGCVSLQRYIYIGMGDMVTVQQRTARGGPAAGR